MATQGRNAQVNKSIQTLLDYFLRKKLYDLDTENRLKEIGAQKEANLAYSQFSADQQIRAALAKEEEERKSTEIKNQNTVDMLSTADRYDYLAREAGRRGEQERAAHLSNLAGNIRRLASEGIFAAQLGKPASKESIEASMQTKDFGSISQLLREGMGISKQREGAADEMGKLKFLEPGKKAERTTEQFKAETGRMEQNRLNRGLAAGGGAAVSPVQQKRDQVNVTALLRKWEKASDLPEETYEWLGDQIGTLEGKLETGLTDADRKAMREYWKIFQPKSNKDFTAYPQIAFGEEEELGEGPEAAVAPSPETKTPAAPPAGGAPEPGIDLKSLKHKSPAESARTVQSIMKKLLSSAGVQWTDEEVNEYVEDLLEGSGFWPKGAFTGFFSGKPAAKGGKGTGSRFLKDTR